MRRRYSALKADRDGRAHSVYVGLIALYRGQGEVHFHLTSPSRALDMYTLALRLAEKEGDSLTEALMRRAIAVCLHRQSKFTKAIRQAEAALAIFRSGRASLSQTKTITGGCRWGRGIKPPACPTSLLIELRHAGRAIMTCSRWMIGDTYGHQHLMSTIV